MLTCKLLKPADLLPIKAKGYTLNGYTNLAWLKA